MVRDTTSSYMQREYRLHTAGVLESNGIHVVDELNPLKCNISECIRLRRDVIIGRLMG